jgi:hypothetical protein
VRDPVQRDSGLERLDVSTDRAVGRTAGRILTGIGGRHVREPNPEAAGIFGLTFIDNDRRALYMNGFQLDVASLPALTSRIIRPPAGCRYYHVTGTETKLVVALVCGKRHHASLITLSTTTFRPTGAPIKLGKCTLPTSLSIAPSDPAALLVEDILGCHTSPTKDPKAALLEIRGVAVHQVLSGKFAFLPGNSVW